MSEKNEQFENAENNEQKVSSESSVQDVQSNELQNKYDQLQAKFLYLNADFDNFRRNVTKERAQWMQTAQGKILESLLQIVDDFDRARADLKNAEDLSEAEKLRLEGFDLIYKSFLKILEKYEVVEIKADGEFSPLHHEAVMQVASDDIDSGNIVEVFQKGYTHKNSVLRPAKVSVAQ